jgi:hypothetical protein
MEYWDDNYNDKYHNNKDFIAGVIAGLKAYAFESDGLKYVGVLGKPLDQEVIEVRQQLTKRCPGCKESTTDFDKELLDGLNEEDLIGG